MKQFKQILTMALGCLLFLLAGCAKDGAVGPAGAAGTNGKNGNANVIQYSFANETLGTGSSIIKTVKYPFLSIDSALTLVYYIDATSSNWYQSPGLGSGAGYQTRYYVFSGLNDSTRFRVNIHNPDGSNYTGSAVTLSKLKIIIAPSGEFHKKAPVDYSDYHATMRYYGLKED
jgi:hypothetical protein